MRQWKPIVGIALIFVAIVGLIVWEVAGRAHMTTDEVLVAKEEIPPGLILTKEMLHIAKVERGSKVEGALMKSDLQRILGKENNCVILKNQQISDAYFQESTFIMDKNLSLFSIPGDWIAMRSSSLRRGDFVELYMENSLEFMGVYQVAFVKDNNENEVKDIESVGKKVVLDRENSTSVISHIEIISTLEQYSKIAAACVGTGNGCPERIIIVQKGE